MLNKTPSLHQSFGPRVFSLSLTVSLSLSLFFRLILWSVEALWVHFPARASKTLSRRRSAPSPHREGAWGLREQSEPHAGALLAFCVNQGISASFSPLLSYRRLWTTRFQSIKGPQHMTKGCKWVAWAGSPDSSHTCCCIIAPPPQLTPVVHIYDQLTKERQSQAWFIDELTWYVDASWKQTAYSTAPGAILIDGGEGKSF